MEKQLNLTYFQEKLSLFARERDWDQFHTPKNLSMALSVEASELVEIFQWLTPDQAKEIIKDDVKMKQISEEVADILSYLLRLSDLLKIDLSSELENKIEKNGEKYPVSKAKGIAKKYNEL